MAKDLKFSLQIDVDKKDGESNLKSFERAFDDALKNIGKSADDVDALRAVFDDIDAGKLKVDELDKATQELYETYREGSALAASQDILGLKALSDAPELIDTFRRLSSETDTVRERMDRARDAAEKIEEQYRRTQDPTEKLQQAVLRAHGEVALATHAYNEHNQQLRETEQRLKSVGVDTDRLSGEQSKLGSIIQGVKDRFKEARDKLRGHKEETDKASKSSAGFGDALGKLKGIIAAYGVTRAIASLVSLNEQYQQLRGEISAAISDHENLDDVWSDVHRTANDLSVPIKTVSDLYVQMRRGTKELNTSSEDNIKITRTMIQSFVASGESIENATSQVRRLAQGLAEGNLGANDLNRIFRRTPELAEAMAKSLGITRDELSKLIAEGRFTSEDFLKGALDSAEQVEDKFSKLPGTVSEAMQRLRNDMLAAFGDTDLSGFNDSLDELRAVLTDPSFVSAIATVGSAIADMAGFFAKATTEIVEFTKYLGDHFAAMVHGIADDDIPRLEMKLDGLKTAMSESWWSRDIMLAFHTRKELEDEFLETQAKLELAYQMQSDAAQQAAKKQAESQKKAQDGARKTAEELEEGVIINDALTKAFERLGIDASAALGRVGAEAEKAIADLDLIYASLDKSAESSRALELAFGAAISAADNNSALVEVTKRLDAAGAAGKLTAEQVERLTKAITEQSEKITDAIPGNERLEKSFQNLGLSLKTLRGEISESEEQMLESFKNITESGETTSHEVATALRAMQQQLKNPEAFAEAKRLAEDWSKAYKGSTREVEQALLGMEEKTRSVFEQISTAIASSTDPEELKSFAARLDELWKNGELGVDQYQSLLTTATYKQELFANALDQSAEAAKNTGADLSEMGDEAVNASTKAAEAAEDAVSSVTGGIGAIADAYNTRIASLGTNAYAAFQEMRGGVAEATDEVAQLQAQLQQFEEEARRNARVVSADFSGIGRALKSIQDDALYVERTFVRQKTAVNELVAGFDAGVISAEELTARAQNLERQFSMLDEQDLQGLRSALSSIQSQADSLSSSLEGTIASLQQELASLQGDTERVEELRHLERKISLEQQLQEARALGDKESERAAQEALRLLEQTYELRLKDLRARQQQTESKTSAASASGQPPAPPPASPSRTVRLELRSPAGKSVGASFDSQRDVDAFLSALEQAGMKAT